MNSGALKALIVMPAFNEEQNIAAIVAETRRIQPGLDIIVVDDGSTDDTVRIARQVGVQVLQLPFNIGVGGAMRTGFKYAREAGYNCVVQIDADGQHDPSFLGALLEELESFDIVIGARFAGQGEYEVSGPRKWAMKMLSWSLSRICHTQLTDTTSGFKALGPRAIDLFAQRYPAEYLGDTVEALVIARRRGLRVTQVPVAMRDRAGGRPSQSPTKAAIYLGRALIALLVGLSRR
jgi:glycosyltransferase involved in cell wall biosynthesis